MLRLNPLAINTRNFLPIGKLCFVGGVIDEVDLQYPSGHMHLLVATKPLLLKATHKKRPLRGLESHQLVMTRVQSILEQWVGDGNHGVSLGEHCECQCK